MSEDQKNAVLPIDVLVKQAEDYFESGNHYDALELLNDFRGSISPVDADAQLLYCRVAETLREHEEYAGAHKALVQAFINRSDANAVHDAALMCSIGNLRDDVLQDGNLDKPFKSALLDDLNTIHQVLSPFVRTELKPNDPEDDRNLHYEVA